MKTILCFFGLLAVVLSAPSETYDAKYDSFNGEELAGNVRLLKSYGKCFLDQGPCTAEGSDFKKLIPESLRTTCAKCTPKQRELIRIVVRGYQEKLPELWAEIAKKEDPNGEYKESFNKFLEGHD